MANLPESPVWHDEIYRLEKRTLVVGGEPQFDEAGNPIGGYSNVPHKQMADRTQWLRERIGEKLQVVEDIDALRLVDPRLLYYGQFLSIVTYGSGQFNDGVVEYYYWDPVSQLPDDGYDVIKPNVPILSGRWIRINNQTSDDIIEEMRQLLVDSQAAAQQSLQYSQNAAQYAQQANQSAEAANNFADQSQEFAEQSEAQVELSRKWAESDTPPDSLDPNSKSSKTWASIAEETINEGITSIEGIEQQAQDVINQGVEDIILIKSQASLEADRASTEADRSQQEANRSQTEADRAETIASQVASMPEADHIFDLLSEASTAAVSLPNGTLLLVVNDGDNNGYYKVTSGIADKTEFQTVTVSEFNEFSEDLEKQVTDAVVESHNVQNQVNDAWFNGQTLVQVNENGVLASFSDKTSALRINPTTGELETRYPTNDPRIMENVDNRLVEPLGQLVTYTSNDPKIIGILVDSEKRLQFWANFNSGQEGVYFQGQKIGGGASGQWFDGVVLGCIDQGQSNSVGQAGEFTEVVYGEYYPCPNRVMMLGSSADNVWLGAPGSSGSSREILPADITGLSRLRGSVGSTGSHATTSAEGFIYAEMGKPSAFSTDGYLLWNTTEGNQTIQNMLNDSTSSFYFRNQVTCITKANELVTSRGQKFSLDWLFMAQGEANTNTSNLGELHDTLRSQLYEAALPITNQQTVTKMMSWQMSSFSDSSTKDGVKSILDFALSQSSQYPNFICAGPTYIFPFNTDFLHQKSVGHAMRGEYQSAIVRKYIEDGKFLPLHATFAEITNTNEITVTLSEPAVIDTNWLVADKVTAGVFLSGGSITNISVTDNKVIITTNSAATNVTAVNFALQGQSSPRTESRIPRSTIRSVNSIGMWSPAVGGGIMYKPMCHQSIAISA